MSERSTSVTDRLEDRIIVIHKDGFDLFDTPDVNSEQVARFVDSLGDGADAAAFNADAHPDHPSVEAVDDAYETLDVKETLQNARRSVEADTDR